VQSPAQFPTASQLALLQATPTLTLTPAVLSKNEHCPGEFPQNSPLGQLLAIAPLSAQDKGLLLTQKQVFGSQIMP